MEHMFQKIATATSATQSSGSYRSRTDEKDSNDASQQESHDRAIQEEREDFGPPTDTKVADVLE